MSGEQGDPAAARGDRDVVPDVVVDARGLRCPIPVIRLAAAARDVPAGTVLAVRSTDPAAAHDVPAWARMRGHRVRALTHDEAAGEWTVTVETVGPSPTAS